MADVGMGRTAAALLMSADTKRSSARLFETTARSINQVTSFMDHQPILEAFASAYVVPAFRDRFVHEAARRPDKLLARVCHKPDDMFEASLAKGRCSFELSEACLILSSPRGFRTSTWAEVQRAMGLGDGFLVIGAAGEKFYAETEATRGAPSVMFAGGG